MERGLYLCTISLSKKKHTHANINMDNTDIDSEWEPSEEYYSQETRKKCVRAGCVNNVYSNFHALCREHTCHYMYDADRSLDSLQCHREIPEGGDGTHCETHANRRYECQCDTCKIGSMTKSALKV
jgi:hypothetical protein